MAERFTHRYYVHHLDYYEIHVDVYEAITRENLSRNGTVNGKLISLSKTLFSGLTLSSVYFDGWLPACAGMTGFFVMYRDKLKSKL
ncbi:hypothetical protein [Legionella moravica]|uniref:hypothetical protein n=1 Tax=Legionella moravica TaxID=39962 RepID=UPI000A989E96|nr:hypothetical protein [Legionella moravica]